MTALSYICQSEGFIPRLYPCPTGYPTVGFGTRVTTWSLGDLSPGARAEVEALMASDRGEFIGRPGGLALVTQEVSQAIQICRVALGDAWVNLNPSGAPLRVHLQSWVDSLTTEGGLSPRQASLLDLHYQMGPGFFRRWPRFKAAVLAGDFVLASQELLFSDPGLTHPSLYSQQTPKRAQRNSHIWLTGDWPSPSMW